MKNINVALTKIIVSIEKKYTNFIFAFLTFFLV